MTTDDEPPAEGLRDSLDQLEQQQPELPVPAQLRWQMRQAISRAVERRRKSKQEVVPTDPGDRGEG